MDGKQVPTALVAALTECGVNGALLAREDSPELTAERGAYLLLLGHAHPIDVIYRKTPRIFPPGWYVYAGNAYGPGGIGARVARHFRRGKPRHWHIDGLTDDAALFAILLPGRIECDLLAELRKQRGFAVPAPGFGSSDCRICESHLLLWRPEGYQPGRMP